MSTQKVSALEKNLLLQSRDAERSLIGSLLLDNLSWDRISDSLLADDFFYTEHRHIFEVITHLNRRQLAVDILTVSEALKQEGLLEKAGGEAYLYDLANNTPSVANIESYLSIVKDRAVSRQLIGICQNVVDQVRRPGQTSPDELLDLAEREIFGLRDQRLSSKGPRLVQDILPATTAKIDELSKHRGAITGLSTGFNDFDKITSGLQAGDLIIIAGRPSMGKTVFGINMAEHAAINMKKPALIFSLEMPEDSIAMRMLSSLGRINQHELRTGAISDDDWPRLSSAASLLSDAKLYIDDTPALNPTELRARARRVYRQTNGELGLIVVDYLQLMTVPGMKDNRVLEIAEISRFLKQIAKELKIPVVALSQLNRGLEQRQDKRPVMSDLRESGAIEQDADLIAFIYRDEVYYPESPDKGIAEIIIAKHRNGSIGKVRLAFMGQYVRFDNYTPVNFDYDV